MTKNSAFENLKIERWTIEDLVPYAQNAKHHPPAQVSKLAASMQEFGFPDNKAIEVDSEKVIINGHGRRLAALKAGLKTVPVVVRSDLTPTQVKAYRLIDNSSAESSYDTNLMSSEMIELQMADFDLTMHFDARDLEFLAGDDLGDMDFSELGADVKAEAEEYAASTEQAVEDSEKQTVPVSKALGFSSVTGSERRKLGLLVKHAEAVTGLTGAAALSEFAVAFVGVK